MWELIDGKKNPTEKKWKVKEIFRAEEERIKLDSIGVGTCFWEALEIPKKSRFSSGKMLSHLRNSEGVSDIDAKRLTSKIIILAG